MTDTFPTTPPLIRTTAMPSDLNPYGTMFGGWIMGQMALAAGSLASRHCDGQASVIGAEGLKFMRPVIVGDELSVWATFDRIGRSSMTIRTDAWRRDRNSEFAERVAEGLFTMVAIGEDKKPRPVPPLETD
ncbi:acyl-CoA thioesterase [uncultured Parasphingopyxis sp.]|uniref:acyl-CoA thioesterase n=1 Tax=uncultured Parasphingopyxis sp. TaxID=1547918 RepID=UPI002630F3EE|nr:acyl-CoA thioesterase [uncultured Parasphingopyxis sp.]